MAHQPAARHRAPSAVLSGPDFVEETDPAVSGGRHPADHDALDLAVRGVGLEPVFQPIVRLSDRRAVGYEALARWPSLNIDRVLDVLAHAEVRGSIAGLDRRCIDAAIRCALDQGMDRNALLLVNSEPHCQLGRGCYRVIERAISYGLQVTVELTERKVLSSPRSLLEKIRRLREHGCRLAVDDIGRNPESLNVLEIIDPDMIKVDLPVLRARSRREQARTLSRVLVHREKTGAVILAEGIETEQDVDDAFELGATLGQGFLLGRPRPLTSEGVSNWQYEHRPHRTPPPGDTPFATVARTHPVRTARRSALTDMFGCVESQAVCGVDLPIVLTVTPHAGAQERYAAMASAASMVAVFTQHANDDPGSGVRCVRLPADDPIAGEWAVVILGAHTASALVARRHPDEWRFSSDRECRYEFVVTYDRTVVTTLAHGLLDRID